MAQIIANTKRSAPTSDSQGDLGGVIARIVEQLGILQNGSVRGLPPRYSLRMAYSGDEPTGLVLVDSQRSRKATIPLTWTDL